MNFLGDWSLPTQNRPFEYDFCVKSNYLFHNISIIKFTKHHRSSSYYCQKSFKYISNSHVNDGYKDCLFGEDEKEEYCIQNKHRFSCLNISNEQKTCLLPSKVGNLDNDYKMNNRDEYISEMNFLLTNRLCASGTSYNCQMLKYYIIQSSYSSSFNTTSIITDDHGTKPEIESSNSHKILFHQYCDTI
ncbi:unnamed protein product [Didymodactylos carnosus]|nr:unnamed protein product [Didymodactylos carnosus]CAF3955769.1 unnamed protein product [Didymodactylos carnosus]